jgi:hypothetical protein
MMATKAALAATIDAQLDPLADDLLLFITRSPLVEARLVSSMPRGRRSEYLV